MVEPDVAANLPAAQVAHDEAPAAEYEPALQFEHAATVVVIASSVLYLLAGQLGSVEDDTHVAEVVRT